MTGDEDDALSAAHSVGCSVTYPHLCVCVYSFRLFLSIYLLSRGSECVFVVRLAFRPLPLTLLVGMHAVMM